jgi:phosphate starvation-inducible protein PhoH and related proteins
LSTLALDLGALDNPQLAALVGPLDEHLGIIARGLQVQIKRRGPQLRIIGDALRIEQAAQVVRDLTQQVPAIDPQIVHLALVQFSGANLSAPAVAGSTASASTPTQSPGPMPSSGPSALHTRRADVSGRTANQRTYIQNIQTHDLTFALGPAGTGKTFLAVACAVDNLERGVVQKIILTRPAVEAGERLGFLPGDLSQKVDPYLRPLYDALHDLMGIDRVVKAFERQIIEIAPLAYMRGRTLNDAFIILDEAQNTTPEQMKMFLTRMGFGSRMVITGDPSQIDLPKGHLSGLIEAHTILRDVKGAAFSWFDAGDIVRHPMVARIVQAYESARAR